jgi:Amt family ammonium transporter
LAVGVTIGFSGFGTFILFKITDKLVGVRVSDKHESLGLDETQHGETAYTNFD